MRISGKVNGRKSNWVKVKQNGSLTLSLKETSIEVPMEAVLMQAAKAVARDPKALKRITDMAKKAKTANGLAQLAKQAREMKV